VELAAVKKTTLCVAALVWFLLSSSSTAPPPLPSPAAVTEAAGAAVDAAASTGVASLLSGLAAQAPADWALIGYSALGPGALATWLQTYGQASVPATLAQASCTCMHGLDWTD
jgi:hypothetical protein